MNKNNSQWKAMRTLCSFLTVILLASVCLGKGPSPDTGMSYRVPSAEPADLVGPLNLGPLSSSSFNGWYRFPTEEKYWLLMENATAYFRDVLVGGETFISGATDGETWTVDAQLPDGSTIAWGTVRFYSSYNNQQNCFVSPWWYLCGTNTIWILWYTSSQCNPTGTWTMNFYNNGNKFHSGQFTLLPQIPPNKVPSGSVFNQETYPNNPYDKICRTGTDRNVYQCDESPNEVEWSIKAKGCLMIDNAMVLNYHTINVNPLMLNTWYNNNTGYDSAGGIYPRALVRYADKVAGKKSNYLGAYLPQEALLENLICTYGPQIIKVKSPVGAGWHWVVVYGRDAAKRTWLISDPHGGRDTRLDDPTLPYNNQFFSIKSYGGPEYAYTDRTGITIRFHSPGELLITDPQGRRSGFDPLTGQSYNEIPGSSYDVIGIADDESGDPGPETKELDIRQPIAGEYTLNVTGTGEGTYILDIYADDPDLNPSVVTFTDIPISSGVVHTYRFYYAKAVGVEIEVVGGFDGGGQRPKDVNKFLSYSNPTESQTSLAAGTTTYPLMIFYGKTIIPTSFAAELNGVDISSRFSPTPGSNQVVNLNLQKGRNVLVLSVNGNLPNRVARDTDRLVFLVP